MLSNKRVAALSESLTYVPEKPCVLCGTSLRYVKNGGCLTCMKVKYHQARAHARKQGLPSYLMRKPCGVCGCVSGSVVTGKCTNCGGAQHGAACSGACRIYSELVNDGLIALDDVPQVQNTARRCTLCVRALARVRAYEARNSRDPQLDHLYYTHVPQREVFVAPSGEDVYRFSWENMSRPVSQYRCDRHAHLHPRDKFWCTTGRVARCLFCVHPELIEWAQEK